MNKTNFLSVFTFLCTLLIVFSACEEHPAYTIDFGSAVIKDTCYVDLANVPAPQAKTVLLEEFTGANCTNCPDAARLVADMIEAKPEGRLLTMSIYAGSIPLTINPDTGERLFVVEEGESLFTGMEGPFIPIGAVDRLGDNDTPLSSKDVWESKVDERLTHTTPVNIDIINHYDETTRVIESFIELRYTENVREDHYISVALIENNILGYQLDNGVKKQDYKHSHVLRDYLTPVSGVQAICDDKNRGRVIIKGFTISDETGAELPLPADFKAEDCEIVAFVHKGSGPLTEIVHVAIAHLVE